MLRRNQTGFSAWISLRGVCIALALAVVLGGCAGGGQTKKHAPKTEGSGYVIAEQPLDAAVRRDFEAAMAALRDGNYKEGIALLEKVTARSQKNAIPFINLAIAYGKIGGLVPAERNLKKALEIKPDHPVVHNEYGLIYRKTGRFAEARTSYQKALENYPDFLPARKNLGILCDIYLRDWDCAIEAYQLYSEAVPNDESVKIWIADVERRLGR